MKPVPRIHGLRCSPCCIFLLCFLLYLGPANASSLDEYVAMALQQNPGLQALRSGNDALRERVEPAGAWADPLVYGGVMNLPTDFSFSGDPMTMLQFGIQQRISLGKKYAHRSEAAGKDYRAGQYYLEAAELLVAYRVRSKYYDLYARQKSIETIRASMDLMVSFVRAASERYSTGKGTQQDVLKAQVEVTHLEEELITMQRMQEKAMAEFNTLLNRDPSGTIDLPDSLVVLTLATPPDTLYREAMENNPVLLRARTRIARDSANLALARAEKSPELSAGFWYGIRQAEQPEGGTASNMMGFSLGVTVPVFSGRKQSPLIEASRAGVKQSQASLEDLENTTGLNIHHALTEARKNRELAELYRRKLIPQAEESLRAGMAGYQQGALDFMTLSDSFLALYQYRLEVIRYDAGYLDAVAELDMLTGKKSSP